MLGRLLGTLAWFAALATTIAASPLDEIRAASGLPAIDLVKLRAGEIVSQRGAIGDFTRGIYVESVYFIHAPVEKVGGTLLHWNPTRHPELGVRQFHEYRWPADPETFRAAGLSSAVSEDRWLLDRSFEVAGDLHLDEAEVQRFRNGLRAVTNASAKQRDAKASELWQQTLQARSESFSQRGLAGVAAYSSAGTRITPATEFHSLLGLAPKIARRFEALINSKPLVANAGISADDTIGYWEKTEVRAHASFELGLIATQRKGDSWQLIDVTYYPADTYFLSADFYQLWPVEGGTLVWQTGFVSAPFSVLAGGLDRLFAAREMIKETASTIQAFRRDVEAAR